MKGICLAVLLVLASFLPAAAQDHTAQVKYYKNQLEAQHVDLSGACGAFAITQRVAWELRFQGYKFLVKQGGNRAILQPDGSCLDGDHASGPGYATDYLISVNEGYVGYDLLGDGGGANNPQWAGPETDADMVDRNKKNFGEPVQPVGGLPQDPTDRTFVIAQLKIFYASICVTPGPRGSGAADIEYYADNIIATGGWTTNTAKGENNVGYWTDRIKHDGNYSGCGGGSTPAPVPSGPSQADLDALKGDIADLRAQVSQLRQALEDKQRQLDSVNGRIDGLPAPTNVDIDLRNYLKAHPIPDGCKVPFLGCRPTFNYPPVQ